MTDNIVLFPGAEKPEADEDRITPEQIMDSAKDRYDDIIIIGRTKGTSRYECVTTLDMSEALFHIVRIQHRLNLYLDGSKVD